MIITRYFRYWKPVFPHTTGSNRKTSPSIEQIAAKPQYYEILQ
jgi:hypothetical protein